MHTHKHTHKDVLLSNTHIQLITYNQLIHTQADKSDKGLLRQSSHLKTHTHTVDLQEEGLAAEHQGVVEHTHPEDGDARLLDQHGTGAQQQTGTQRPHRHSGGQTVCRITLTHTPGEREREKLSQEKMPPSVKKNSTQSALHSSDRERVVSPNIGEKGQEEQHAGQDIRPAHNTRHLKHTQSLH